METFSLLWVLLMVAIVVVGIIASYVHGDDDNDNWRP